RRARGAPRRGLRGGRDASRAADWRGKSSACDWRPQDREMWVEVERMAKPEPRHHRMAEAPLDHPAVKLLERIARPEPKGALREAQRLSAVAGPRERPSQYVVAVDRRPIAPRRTRQRQCAPRPNTVVDVEESRLQVRLHAVRAEQP